VTSHWASPNITTTKWGLFHEYKVDSTLINAIHNNNRFKETSYVVSWVLKGPIQNSRAIPRGEWIRRSLWEFVISPAVPNNRQAEFGMKREVQNAKQLLLLNCLHSEK
jgi:hypothetical protein